MISRSYTPEEALEVIKLRMNYNSAKTLNENLTVLSEQLKYNTIPQSRPMPSDYTGKGGEFERQRYSNTDKENYYHLRNTLPVINGTSVSDVIIKTREYFFTTAGMTTQVVLSILGSEIGAPIVFGIIDGVIILNDLISMKKEWRTSNKTPWSYDWFLFHLQDGPGMNAKYGNGFLRFMEDLLLLATGGIVKLIGKGAKAIYSTVMSKIGKNIGPTLGKISLKISSVGPMIKKLPKSIAQYYEKLKGETQSAINLLKSPKTALQSVKKNVVRAGISGALAYGFFYFFEKKVVPLLAGKDNEITEFKQNVNDSGLIEEIVYENPKLFPNGIKKFQIVTNKNKQFVKFVIDGQNYKIKQKDTYLLEKM